MKKYLIQHATAHPILTARDVIKYCYQAVFGAEHLLCDKAAAHAYFAKEWNTVPSAELPLYEQISDRYARVNLAAWKQAGLPAEWLFRMFFMTASTPSQASMRELDQLFETVEETLSQNAFSFSAQDWKQELTAYREHGGGPVHHSEAYRAAARPSYRIVACQYTELIPLLKHLISLPSSDGIPRVIAIDGRAASGKTTLAKHLASVLGAGTVHMDDFFLPPELRTTERLSEAGGNVHYERFCDEILPCIKHNKTFHYNTFNCSKMCLNGKRSVEGGTWRIVEGSYSHHPKLGDYMDTRVFCHVSPEEQMQRIRERNGEAMAGMFASRWIPMEEHYFRTFMTEQKSDYQWNTENKGEEA